MLCTHIEITQSQKSSALPKKSSVSNAKEDIGRWKKRDIWSSVRVVLMSNHLIPDCDKLNDLSSHHDRFNVIAQVREFLASKVMYGSQGNVNRKVRRPPCNRYLGTLSFRDSPAPTPSLLPEVWMKCWRKS